MTTADPPPTAADSAVRLAAHLAAAEPGAGRPLGALVERLAAEGRLRGLAGAGTGAGGSTPGLVLGGVTEDSRRVTPGSLFVAVPGRQVDGHDFVRAAERSGAAAAIVEHAVPGASIPLLVVDAAPGALASAAAWWYGDPSHALGVVGITGTDGKTTTSFLAQAVLEAAGLRPGLLGTVEIRIGADRLRNPEHVTTPGAPRLQALLRAMVEAGNRTAVIESTSHGLALERVGAIAYDVALFTNLSHEHLEFHGTLEAYRDAKLRLFERLATGPANPADPANPAKVVGGRPWPKAGIVNRDDPAAPAFERATLAAGARLVTYGEAESADVRAVRVDEDAERLRVAYAAPSGSGTLELRLAGRFNVHNALAIVALGEVLGLDPGLVRAGLAGVTGVPGRMERIEAGQPFAVVVDFAHSPASLAFALETLAPLAAARGGGLVAVFGSAGERDTAKRPMLGRVAAERCRLIVVTDEDPRGEAPEAILEAIADGALAAGARSGETLLVIPDRRAAIAAAFERARPGDVVLLAGKGHEQTIEYATGDLPWDEARVAREVLAELGWHGAGADR